MAWRLTMLPARGKVKNFSPDFLERFGAERRVGPQQVIRPVPPAGAAFTLVIIHLDESVVPDNIQVVAGDQHVFSLRPQHRKRIDDTVVVPKLEAALGRAVQTPRDATAALGPAEWSTGAGAVADTIRQIRPGAPFPILGDLGPATGIGQFPNRRRAARSE